MKALSSLLVIALAVSSSIGDALGSEDLARKYGCLACHAIDKKVVGPAYKDIAAKYRNDPAAEAKLSEKLQTGGAGNWGEAFMPSMQLVPTGDLKTLVKWILSLK